MGSEKFCLRWNDFENNISVAFRELREDKDFFDVTLACDDDHIQAHKVILSACSPFFRNVLRKNSHQHPLLYLKGVKYTDIQAVLNFMYHGEVNVAQDELNSFLAVAEDLRVKGLTQNGPSQQTGGISSSKTESEPPKQAIRSRTPPPPHVQPPVKKIVLPPAPEDDDIQEVMEMPPDVKREIPDQQQNTSYNQPQTVDYNAGQLETYQEQYGAVEEYGDYDDDGTDYNGQQVHVDQANQGDGGGGVVELGSEINYLLSQGAEDFVCSLCGARFSRKDNARRHVKLVHGRRQDDESRLCDICHNSYKNQLALDNHKRNIHRVFKTVV